MTIVIGYSSPLKFLYKLGEINEILISNTIPAILFDE